MMFETRLQKHVATCLSCGAAHHYAATKHPVENDWGHWLVACRKCGTEFVLRVRNPDDSDPGDCLVIERFDDDVAPYTGSAPGPGESAIHNLNLNADLLRFDPDKYAIYRCASIGADLEKAAFAALEEEWGAVTDQIGQAANQMLARSMLPDVEHACVRIAVPCACGQPHRATFYRPFRLNGSAPPALEMMLLADVTGTDLEDILSGLRSKTDVMDALEKLIARWRLFNDQILIAAPFVAHQFTKKAERLAIWERLLSLLDATRTVLLTRAATYKEYKAALADSGLDYEMLERFGLENKVVGDGRKKQDSHSKVYIGLGDECEVLSGSANLVRGKSKENISFDAYDRAKVDEDYIDEFGLKLPIPRPRLTHHLLVELQGGSWRWNLPAGAAPAR